MARSAAAKKVAKAASAGAGGKGAHAERSFLFPMAMVLVVALGVVLIFVARDQRTESAPRGAPLLSDHWHSTFNLYVCDEISPTTYPNDSEQDLTGLHTHGDGLIHIHPFVSTVSAQYATIGAFMKETEVEFDDATLELPNGIVLREDEFTCGEGEDAPPAELRILKWNTLAAETPIRFTENLADVRFNENGQLFTIAMVDPSTADEDIPRPDDSFLRDYLGLSEEQQPIGEADTGTGPVIAPPAADEGSGTDSDSEPDPTEGSSE